MKTKPTPGEIVTMAGGAATIVFSLLAFFVVPGGGPSFNAWDTGLFPIATYATFAGLISGGTIALRRFANVRLPANVGGFSWEQVHLLLGIFAGLIMGGYLISDKGFDYGIGFWGVLAGTVALIVGAVMMPKERHGPRGLA